MEAPGFIPLRRCTARLVELGACVVAPDDPFAVISTAAVDIVPRGAVLTHTNFLMANLQTIACMGLTEADASSPRPYLSFHIAALGSADDHACRRCQCRR